jgi:hypothetical protein
MQIQPLFFSSANHFSCANDSLKITGKKWQAQVSHHFGGEQNCHHGIYEGGEVET